MIRKLAIYVALLPITLLCACSILPAPSPVNVYQLPPTSFKEVTTAPTKSLSLRINRPNSNIQINSQRIIVIPEPNLVSSYEGVRWSDSAPTMVRNRVINAFITDGRIKSISSDDKTLYADYEIDSYLQSFQTEYIGGVPKVVIRLDAQLVNVATMKIVANRRFEIIQDTSGVKVPQIVIAFGEASNKITGQLIDWTIANVESK